MIFELPLFPLNTVLFPGMPVHLHIFEERYKTMIQHCLDQDKMFGVVLIEQGVEAGRNLATPHLIGCTAQITHVERLAEGRLNLLAIGQERFRINTLDQTAQPYLVGQVDLFPLPNENADSLADVVRLLRPLVESYLIKLGEAGQTTAQLERLTDNPLLFCYLAATLLQIPVSQKQNLLAALNIAQLVHNLQTIYRRELMLLDVLLAKPDENRPDGYKLN
ncbi:LON peptidase substrate-binding domain-containing protein [Chloroflexota bacterium]